MMHKIVSFFSFFLLVFTLNAQVKVSGKIINPKQEPLEAVFVYWDVNQPGAMTNADGEFQLDVSKEVEFLTIDHYEYELKKVSITSLLENKNIQLEEYVVQLNEALLLDKKADVLLSEVLKASKTKLDKSQLVHTFYREFIQLNNQYTHYSDGLLDFYIKRNSGKSDVYVRQSRNFQLISEEESEQNLALSTSSPFDIRNALRDAFQFEQIEEILKQKNFYHFHVYEFKDEEGKVLRKIEISPKDTAKELLVEGSVLYDVESNLILDYAFRAAPETLPFSKLYNFLIAKVKINDFNMHFNFRLEKGKYKLAFRRIDFDCYIKFGKKINDNFQFTSDFVVLDYKEDVPAPTDVKKYTKRNLYEAGTHYTEEYWKSIQMIIPTKKEQELIDRLQKNE